MAYVWPVFGFQFNVLTYVLNPGAGDGAAAGDAAFSRLVGMNHISALDVAVGQGRAIPQQA